MKYEKEYMVYGIHILSALLTFGITLLAAYIAFGITPKWLFDINENPTLRKEYWNPTLRRKANMKKIYKGICPN